MTVISSHYCHSRSHTIPAQPPTKVPIPAVSHGDATIGSHQIGTSPMSALALDHLREAVAQLLPANAVP